MPSQATINGYLKRLADGSAAKYDAFGGHTYSHAELAVSDMHGARAATVTAIVEAVLEGARVHGWVLHDLANYGKVRAIVRAQIRHPFDVVADPNVSFNRLMLTFYAYNWPLTVKNPLYEPFRKNLSTRLRAGLIPKSDDLLWLAQQDSVFEEDSRFGLTILANSTWTLKNALHGARPDRGHRLAEDFAKDKWAAIYRQRERLTMTRWLPAQIPAADYREVKMLTPSMIRDLFPQVWADGYAGYARAVAAKTAIRG